MVGAVVLAGTWRQIPAGDNPFVPLRLDDPAGVATPLKLARALNNPALCRTLVEEASLSASPVADRRVSDMCAFENAFAIERSITPYSAPVQVSCPLAATLYLWERDVLQPLAEEHLGEPIARIEHVGSYACRNVRGGRSSNRPSQHATANALDVTGFRLASGDVVSVKQDWDEDGPRGRFLDALHARSCRLFSGVLGPEYNAAHADHFHLDMGPYSLCR